jgi:hypothetical protein
VESAPGQGTVFRIELPVEEAPVAILAPPPVETLATPQGGVSAALPTPVIAPHFPDR